mmetsp:Transcript_65080/g.210782  ORF Transcript_65080/g.210782 Transcript_65080/m.210782 type:complete len:141 (-) Transcript_65080:400-822(-)
MSQLLGRPSKRSQLGSSLVLVPAAGRARVQPRRTGIISGWIDADLSVVFVPNAGRGFNLGWLGGKGIISGWVDADVSFVPAPNVGRELTLGWLGGVRTRGTCALPLLGTPAIRTMSSAAVTTSPLLRRRARKALARPPDM